MNTLGSSTPCGWVPGLGDHKVSPVRSSEPEDSEQGRAGLWGGPGGAVVRTKEDAGGRVTVLRCDAMVRDPAAQGRREERRVLRVERVQHAWEGNGLPDVIDAADPGHDALDPHPETRVRHGAVLPQI